MTAVILDVLAAVTLRAPAETFSALETTWASAELRSMLVAIAAFTAMVSPAPSALPPFMVTVASLLADRIAASVACTVTSPPVTLIFVLVMVAVAPPRTSFRVTRPPTAMASELLMLLPCGMTCVPSSDFQ